MKKQCDIKKVIKILSTDIIFKLGLVWTFITILLFYPSIYTFFSEKSMFDEEIIAETIFITFALTYSLAGVIMLIMSIIRAIQTCRLFKIGIPATATVSRIRITLRMKLRGFTISRSRHPSLVTIEYHFKNKKKKEIAGKLEHIRYEKALDLKYGDKIKILYHPKNPDRTLWVDSFDL